LFGASLTDAFRSSFALSQCDSKNNITIAINDADRRIVSMELQDANGQRLQTRSTWGGNTLRTYGFQTPPPADARLVVYVATPDAIRSYPFALENIPLP
jgi:hypothetical protein